MLADVSLIDKKTYHDGHTNIMVRLNNNSYIEQNLHHKTFFILLRDEMGVNHLGRYVFSKISTETLGSHMVFIPNMVPVLNSASEKDAYVRSNLYYLFCLIHKYFFLSKIPIFHDAGATCTELPSNIVP